MGFCKWGLIEEWKPNCESSSDWKITFPLLQHGGGAQVTVGNSKKVKESGKAKHCAPKILIRDQCSSRWLISEVVQGMLKGRSFSHCVLTKQTLLRKFCALLTENRAHSDTGWAKAVSASTSVLWFWTAAVPAELSHLFALAKPISPCISMAISCTSPLLRLICPCHISLVPMSLFNMCGCVTQANLMQVYCLSSATLVLQASSSCWVLYTTPAL